MKALARELGISRHEAAGIMNDVWEWAGEYVTDGAVGRHTNGGIADGIEYQGDPDALIKALIATGWINECEKHRLQLHNWPTGCEQWVKKRIQRGGNLFTDEDTDEPMRAKPQKSAFTVDFRAAFEIYDAYPRHVGRGAAVKAINAAAARLRASGVQTPYRTLLEAATAYAASPAGQKPPGVEDFRPHPRTFFSQDRHLDDQEAWQKPNGIGTDPAAAHKAANESSQRVAEQDSIRRRDELAAAGRGQLDIESYLNTLTPEALTKLKAETLASLPPASAARFAHLDPRGSRVLRGAMYSHAMKGKK